ncbi:MAG: MipA/OmpV family protein [Erythrobacter sp.]
MAYLRSPTSIAALLSAMLASPVWAEEGARDQESSVEAREEQGSPAGPPPGSRADGERPVFDDTWATVGIGIGLVPSYSGSDDYRVFPLPLVVGRIGGVGISPNGPGFNLDLLSDPPARGPGGASSGSSFSFGPSFRLRNDRNGDIGDDVVELAGELDTAFEIGANAGVSFPGVFRRGDRLGVSAQVGWDVAGAHEGMLIQPGVSYFTPVGRAASLQFAASASFVDDDYADYYYSVSQAQSAASGLPQFSAEGGLDSLGTTAIATLDLDGNALNGGLSLYAIGGYSRVMGDGADTPYTSIRGSADQFIGGIGVGYTF